MDRGLRAQLSPNEENTLRRIAMGLSHKDELNAQHVAHLAALQLIERPDGVWRLTALGRARNAGEATPY